ncbi:hypothetical protein C1H57_08405 [Clostridium sp. 2-1]|uniref:hypothetical protein n=1 Tax=Clostridium TaxID=1485 RepID=UPI000CDB5464|nr:MULTISPECIES: hypothetical protein [Clostridium]MBN7575428.1 hypothetical protein [Clostridium beijerinckii]MBN7580739.1 hypothetical protein [Clostridium beijerinckii]MBN7585192.1 hypothetical protein [Clostridium beijerinckii]MBO0522002.1 hypothetical protein [Clostridium beijerinckii]POO91830.1 hypothetical protein C1H57_08405 [Clostridium sp. 2-1]
MAVADYTTIQKSSVDAVIKDALEVEHITSAPIEHYTQDELKEMAEKAKKNDLVISIRAEHSNFYQGVLLSFIKRKSIDDTFVKYI